jgi:hypothetical protein
MLLYFYPHSGKTQAMRREIVLPAALAALLLILAVSGTWWLLAPSSATWLVPPGATIVRVEQLSTGRERIAVRLADRQNRYDVYEHLNADGWRLRQSNGPRQESDQVYFRNSLGGYMLEVAMVVQADDDRHTLMILYQRCLRRVTCGIR